MNIFVLCTGRCGSVTFIQACEHITNYSAAHESRIGKLGIERVAYPINHIEADNRLSWHLGRLDRAYGNDAFYVHLQRDRLETAASFRKRHSFGGAIMSAYEKGILMNRYEESGSLDVCLDYCDTVNTNIALFLANKTKKMEVWLETAQKDFAEFWGRIGANGDLAEALAEWKTKYNPTVTQTPTQPYSLTFRLKRKTKNTIASFLSSH